MIFHDEITIVLICPKCGVKQNALIFKNGEWDNKCFYCGYIFSPVDLYKAGEVNEKE